MARNKDVRRLLTPTELLDMRQREDREGEPYSDRDMLLDHIEILRSRTTLLELADDAFDLDVIDVLNQPVADTWAAREYAAAIASVVTAVLDAKDPAALNRVLNDHLEYQGGHFQPHEQPVEA